MLIDTGESLVSVQPGDGSGKGDGGPSLSSRVARLGKRTTDEVRGKRTRPARVASGSQTRARQSNPSQVCIFCECISWCVLDFKQNCILLCGKPY